MLEFLASPTFRRILAAVVGLVLPLLNSKLGLNIPPEQVISAMALMAVYIGQSVANTMHARSVEAGAAASADVSTKAVAIAELTKPAP